MAGAGYKLFNTGDVLTAAQVNTYLQEQTVMVFANSTARTTALSGVLAEGMVTYLKDTDAIEKYTGAAWVNIDSGSTSPLTTKGDLYTYSTTDARLAVGNNGDTIVADSSATTGLRWQGNFAAGKNKIINGDFFINQRNFSSTTADGYGFDRWATYRDGGTVTYSAQTFTPGTAPVAGYEAANFARVLVASQTLTTHYASSSQPIEDVRTLAGQTATISFWAKAASGTPKIAVEANQKFGSGGSPSAIVNTYAGQVTLSTSWARYSVTVSIPSISGKTIGTTANTSSLEIVLWFSAGSSFNSRTGSLGIQNGTFDVWGLQVEAGSVATAFQTATGTLAGELAACQRYYFRHQNPTTSTTFVGIGFGGNSSTTKFYPMVNLPVTMRVAPTAVDWANAAWWNGTGNTTVSALTISNASLNVVGLEATSTGLTGNEPYMLVHSSTAGYVGFSAEL